MSRWCHGVVLIAVCLGGSGPAFAASPSLEQARAALGSFELDKVLPLLKKAVRETRDKDELIDIYLLMTDMYVTYDRHAKAVRAFVEVLERDPTYEPEPGSSPKIVAAWQDAKQKLAPPAKKEAPELQPKISVETESTLEASPRVTSSAPVGDEPQTEEPDEVAAAPKDVPPDYLVNRPEDAHGGAAIYKQWWFWAGIGVVAVSAGGLAAYLAAPKLPPYSYGPVVLTPP